MSINPISGNIVNLISTVPTVLNQNDDQQKSAPFADILSASFDTVRELDQSGKSGNVELLAGQGSDDLSAILIGGQKAEIALSLSLSMRNKVLEAYQEVMRLSV